MTITVSTAKLAETLIDALQTTETDPDAMGPGIHIATHRSPYGESVGVTDVLAATSTDRFVIGHSSIVVNGQIIPSVWPADATRTVVTICKQLIAARGKEHTVDIEVVEMVTDGEQAGFVVTVRETPALFDTDTEFQFNADHESKFPLATAERILSGNAAEDENRVDGPETMWTPRVLTPLAAIAKRRKSTMRFFKYPRQRPHLVQIGPYWLGAAMPADALPGEGLREPSVEPLINVPPTAAGELHDALAAMKADGITVTVENPKGPVAQTLADAINDTAD